MRLIYFFLLKDFKQTLTTLISIPENDTGYYTSILYNVTYGKLHYILQNERHWGDVISDAGDINWEVDEATCIRITKNKDLFYSEIKEDVHTLGPEYAYPEVFKQYCNFEPKIVHLAKDNSEYQI